MTPYLHTVHYYETDRMGVAHHSNYVRWMEEARVDFLSQLGFPYDRMEADGVVSPVVSLSCEYKRTTTFGDVVSVRVSVGAFDGAVVKFLYEMTDAAGALVFRGSSEHVFLGPGRRVLRLRRSMPEFAAALDACLAEKSGGA